MSRLQVFPAAVKPESLIIDSNLLLLWIVGLLNPAVIQTHKRLNTFSVHDYLLVAEYISTFRRILTTPYVLAEVSNLAGAATGQLRAAIMDQLATTITILEEKYAPAATLLNLPEARIFGLTDTALAQFTKNTVVLTDDGRLAHHLRLSGMSALTMRDLRELATS